MLLSDKTSAEYVFSRKILKDSGALSNSYNPLRCANTEINFIASGIKKYKIVWGEKIIKWFDFVCSFSHQSQMFIFRRTLILSLKF